MALTGVSVFNRAQARLADFGGPVGNPAGDDSAIFEAAIASLASGGGVVIAEATTYYLNRIIVLPENITLQLSGSTIRCTSGSDRSHFITIAGHDAKVIGGVFLGTGQRPPGKAYSHGTYPGTAIFVTNGVARSSIEDCRFEDFGGGPILAYHETPDTLAASELAVRRCIFRNVQKYTRHQTNAIVNLHRCDDSLIEDCVAESYRWKGFYLGNCIRSRIERCLTNGGSDGKFDSSYHIVGDTAGIYSDNGVYDCQHRGLGAGFKLDTSLRPTVMQFKSSGAFGGIVQGCQDFVLEEIESRNDPDQIGYGLAVTGLAGLTSSGTIRNAAYELSGPGRPGNTAISVGGGGGVFGPIEIINPSARNAYWGLSLVNDGTPKSVSIVNPQFENCQQYGVVAFAGSIKVSGGSIRMTSAVVEAALFVATDGWDGGVIDIDGVAFFGSTGGRNIQIGGGFGVRHEALRVRNCSFSGGVPPLELTVGDKANNKLSELEVRNNSGWDSSVEALGIVFGRDPTRVIVDNNLFWGVNHRLVRDTLVHPGRSGRPSNF